MPEATGVHKPEVKVIAGYGPFQPEYQAGCACGWRGRFSLLRLRARFEAWRHRRAASPSPSQSTKGDG